MTGADQNQFRPDVEGLRALAILPILIFHIAPDWLPGGFVGVDIFFVISGFLITGSIVGQGTGFSYPGFLYRRFRRLYPALFVTLVAGLAAGYKLFTPDDYARLAVSTGWGLFGLANFYFDATTDYFANNVLLHPNLHLWSLAVEEQFYLIWPLLLVYGLSNAHRQIGVGIVVVGLGSFLAALLFIDVRAEGVFYQMPFRAFEFAMGAAAWYLRPVITQSRLISLLSMLGLLGVGASSFILHEQLAWPSLYTLLPCLATALVLLGNPQSLAGQALALSPVRWIGRISYSTYLVHWPLIVFYSVWNVTALSLADQVGLFAASLVLGWVLYAFVEQTLRIGGTAPHFFGFRATRLTDAARRYAPDGLGGSYTKAVLNVAPVLFVALLSTAIVTSGGLPSRWEKHQAARAGELSFGGDVCSVKTSRCVFGDRTSSRIVYVVGDSHAMNYFTGLDKLFAELGVKGIGLYDQGCLFLSGTKRFIRGVADEQCADNVEATYGVLEGSSNPVIFAGAYAGYQMTIGEREDPAPAGFELDRYLEWSKEKWARSLQRIGAHERPTVVLLNGYDTGVDMAR